jgi:hypothetical protein
VCGLRERDSAGCSCGQVGADPRVRGPRTRVYTRETGGVPIYNGDIIADYLRFRVDNRKFSRQKGADRFQVLLNIQHRDPSSLVPTLV